MPKPSRKQRKRARQRACNGLIARRKRTDRTLTTFCNVVNSLRNLTKALGPVARLRVSNQSDEA